MSPDAEPSRRRTEVGQIVGPVGLKGVVRVNPRTQYLERFEAGSTLILRDEPVRVLRCSWHGTQARLLLEGIETLEQAEDLRWEILYASGQDRPELEPDEYLWSDLLGMEVFDEEGQRLGQVEKILPLPAHDVFQVGERLIPAVSFFVKKVDVPGNRMVVRLIEGM